MACALCCGVLVCYFVPPRVMGQPPPPHVLPVLFVHPFSLSLSCVVPACMCSPCSVLLFAAVLCAVISSFNLLYMPAPLCRSTPKISLSSRHYRPFTHPPLLSFSPITRHSPALLTLGPQPLSILLHSSSHIGVTGCRRRNDSRRKVTSAFVAC